MINTKPSDSGPRRVEYEHYGIDNTVFNEPAAHPIRSEVDLERVFEWFGLHSPARRINLMYGLLHMCQPLELRFLGACLEDLARKDFPVLREFEMNANGPTTDLMEQLGDVLDPVGWSKLLVYLSLLGSDNRDSAGTLYRAFSQIDLISLLQSTNSTDTDSPSHSSGAAQTCQQHSPLGGLGVGSEILESSGWFPGNAERTLEHLALLYTMASLHPAFSFQHREVAKLKLVKVEQEMERRRNIGHLQRMSSVKQQNRTVQKADVVSSLGAEQRGRSPQSHHTSPTTSPQGRDAVTIDCLLLKKVTWKRPNWEYTIETQWSDSSQTTVTKTHHQLESFLSELPYVSSSHFFQKRLSSLLQQADQYEPRELENTLRELLLTAPSPFRQREQICSYFLPHSQSKTLVQAPEQPQLNGLVERTSGADTLSSNPNVQMTAEGRGAYSQVWRGRGRGEALEGPKTERHQVRRSDGFGAPSGLQRKLLESLEIEEEEEEETGFALSTSNLTFSPFGAAILQATPTRTPGPMANTTAPLTLSPALSPIHTLTSSLTTSPLLSPGLTPPLSPQSECELCQSQCNLIQMSYHIGLPTSSTVAGSICSPTPWSAAPPLSPLSSHDSSPTAPLSSLVLLSSPQPCSSMCSPTSSNSSPRGSMSSPVRGQSPQPNLNVCGPVPMLSPQSFSPIRSSVPNYSPQLPSPVSSPVHTSRTHSSSFAPSPVSVSCPQPRTPAPRPFSKSSPHKLTTPAQSPASISSSGPSTPVKSPGFVPSAEPSPISGSQTCLQPLVGSEKSSVASSAAEGNCPFFSLSVIEDQSHNHVEVLEKRNPEVVLSQQNQNYMEPLSQKHVQAQSHPQHQNQTQDHNEVLSQESILQSQLQSLALTQSHAQTQSLPQSQAQEVLSQEHMIQTRPLSQSQSPVKIKAQSQTQDHTNIKTEDHNDGEADVQLDPTQPMPVSVTSELHVQQNLIQALPCPGQNQPHSQSDQVFQVQQNLIHSLPYLVMAGQTQNVSIAEFQTQHNLIQSPICMVTTVQSQSCHTDQVPQVHLSPIHSVNAGQLPSSYPHGPGSFLAPTSVVALTPVLVSPSSFSQAPIFTHASTLGQATVLAPTSSSSQATILTPTSCLDQATVFATTSAPILASMSSLCQAVVPAQSLAQVPTVGLSPGLARSPSPAPDLSPDQAPAQVAVSGFAPVPTIYQTPLARSHSSSYSLQSMASFSPFYAPLYSSLGLCPGAGLDQSSGTGVKKAAGGTVSCYNCGHSGHSAEDCKEPSRDPAQQGGFQLKYSTSHPSEAYDNTD